jgi:hypothetical protein
MNFPRIYFSVVIAISLSFHRCAFSAENHTVRGDVRDAGYWHYRKAYRRERRS